MPEFLSSDFFSDAANPEICEKGEVKAVEAAEFVLQLVEGADVPA